MSELELFTNSIPVMGAWLQFLPAIAGIAGKLFSGASQGRSEGRAAEIGVTQEQDAATLDRARLAEQQAARQQGTNLDLAGLDLERREYTDKARSQGYNDRARGGLLQGLQDFEIEAPEGITVGKISGGLRPSAILNKEALGRDMERGAIQRGLEGPQFADVERVDGPAIPGLSELPKAGKLDSFLNIASLISNLAGGVGEAANVIRGSSGGGGGSTASTPNAARANASRVFRGGRL
jgi:hypothetical protein